MSIFSYHLIKLPLHKAVRLLWTPPSPKEVPGLIHIEYMHAMTLGSPILSAQRFLLNEIAIFAQWQDETSLTEFLATHKHGKLVAKGWHLRLLFMREWGSFAGFETPDYKASLDQPGDPVVAVTLARMKPLQVPRFLHWGRPVEKLVRDHQGTLLSLASYRFPNIISTFSIWKNQDEMIHMVHGHGQMPNPKRHKKAMEERSRKNFHFEFTTLRFKPISEFGSWKGKENYISGLNTK